MELKITAGVNAGIVCSIGGHRIWCDVLHDENVPGLSSVTPDRLKMLLSDEAFAAPELVFYTHCHPDHYSEKMTEEVLKRYHNCYQVLPERKTQAQILISGAKQRIRFSDITIEFVRLTHEGRQYENVPHYGCMISCGGMNVFIAGDCAIALPALAEYLADKKVDAAVMPFPWITLPKGRSFTEEYIRPKHLIINHLPLEADDIYGYRRAAMDTAHKVNVPEITLFTNMLQEAVIKE